MELMCPVEGCEGIIEIGWEEWDDGDGVWAQSGWSPYIVSQECGHTLTAEQEESVLHDAAVAGPDF